MRSQSAFSGEYNDDDDDRNQLTMNGLYAPLETCTSAIQSTLFNVDNPHLTLRRLVATKRLSHDSRSIFKMDLGQGCRLFGIITTLRGHGSQGTTNLGRAAADAAAAGAGTTTLGRCRGSSNVSEHDCTGSMFKSSVRERFKFASAASFRPFVRRLELLC